MTLISACVLSCSAVQLSANLWTEVCQAPLSMGCPGKNIKVGCHFLLQGNLSDPGIKHVSPALTGGFLPTEPAGSLFQAHTEGLFSTKGNRAIWIEEGEGIRQHQSKSPGGEEGKYMGSAECHTTVLSPPASRTLSADRLTRLEDHSLKNLPNLKILMLGASQ